MGLLTSFAGFGAGRQGCHRSRRWPRRRHSL